MGQRSQIYVRLKDKDNKKHFMANYYQWNYSERMISRARYGIGWIKNHFDYLHWKEQWGILSRIFDVNFDMIDIVMHSDMVLEYAMEGSYFDFKDSVITGADNNDGKLLLDIDQQTKTIKYAFLDCEANPDNIMDGTSYMEWDNEGCVTEKWDDPTDFFPQDAIDTCKKNIEEISQSAALMTKEEVEDFVNDDYEKILGVRPIYREENE